MPVLIVMSKVTIIRNQNLSQCVPYPLFSKNSLLEENAKPTMQEVEDNFDGNICRCTGRSIEYIVC